MRNAFRIRRPANCAIRYQHHVVGQWLCPKIRSESRHGCSPHNASMICCLSNTRRELPNSRNCSAKSRPSSAPDLRTSARNMRSSNLRRCSACKRREEDWRFRTLKPANRRCKGLLRVRVFSMIDPPSSVGNIGVRSCASQKPFAPLGPGVRRLALGNLPPEIW